MATPPPLELQMRVQRVSLSDAGNLNLHEFNLVSSDRGGFPLQPETVNTATFYCNVTDDFQGILEHDQLVTVAIYPPAPPLK